jgi:hypothetical protein
LPAADHFRAGRLSHLELPCRRLNQPLPGTADYYFFDTVLNRNCNAHHLIFVGPDPAPGEKLA